MAGDVAMAEVKPAAAQSGNECARWAEYLIRQLPANHDGRNIWLLNFGSDKAEGEKASSEA